LAHTQLDANNAFLHSMLIETIYYSQPTDFIDPAHPQLVFQLNKSLYDLKQTPSARYHYFTCYLVSLSLANAKSGTFLFIYCHGTDTAYLLLYIDYIVLASLSLELL
jgi:hypothetical protein